MKKREEDDQEFQALRMSHKASIEASGMTRDELIDLLARNLAAYNLLCRSYENNCHQLEDVIKIRTELCKLLEHESAEHKRKLMAVVGALPSVIEMSMKAGGKSLATEAGRKGLANRNAPIRELKEWVIQEAAMQRGSHKGIARELAKRIPKHLEEASKDPERLIYDTLRAAKKPSVPRAVRGFTPFAHSR